MLILNWVNVRGVLGLELSGATTALQMQGPEFDLQYWVGGPIL